MTLRAFHVWKWKRLIGGLDRRHDWMTVGFGVVAIHLTQIVEWQWFGTNEYKNQLKTWRNNAPTRFEVTCIKYEQHEDCYTSVCPFQLM